MKLKSTFFAKRSNSDLYHEFEETGDKGGKMKLLFKSKASRGSLFSPRRRADGSFPAATATNCPSAPTGDYYGTCYDSDERDDVAALSRDFVDSSRMQPSLEQPTLSPISEGAKRSSDSLEEDNPVAGAESLDLLPLPHYESFSTAEDVVDIANEAKGSFWSDEWDPPDPEFPPPPSVSTLSGDDPGTLATQSSTSVDESSRLFTDDDASISSSSTEKRDNSSGLFPISECSQSEAPKQVSPKPKCAAAAPKTLVESRSDLKALERELQARLDVIHTLKSVITKQGDVITSQKKTIKKHERKLDESRRVIKCLYRQHVRFKGQISHLQLEAELHEARAMWSKQELFTVRTELHDMKAGFTSGEIGCNDLAVSGASLENCQRNEISKNATISTAESSAEDSNIKEEATKLTLVEQAGDQHYASIKVGDALQFDEDSTDNTLLFGASSNDSDSLGFAPKSHMLNVSI